MQKARWTGEKQQCYLERPQPPLVEESLSFDTKIQHEVRKRTLGLSDVLQLQHKRQI